MSRPGFNTCQMVWGELLEDYLPPCFPNIGAAISHK
jgi:hypothetical protein